MLKPSLYIRKDQNTAYLRLRSKGAFYFLEKTGFVKGRKEQIGIPEWIRKNNEYMTCFIRGLFDTNGSLALKKKNYPVISISSKSKTLILLVHTWLTNKGFSSCFSKETKKDKRNDVVTQLYRVELNGKKKLKKWIELIGFSNNKHIKKMGRVGLPHLMRLHKGFEPTIVENHKK